MKGSLAIKINKQVASSDKPSTPLSARVSTAAAFSPVKKSNFTSTPKTVTTIVHNLNNRKISMTVSLITNNKYESAQHKDFVIHHESKVDKCLTARPMTSDVRSPRRDPILQENNEEAHEFRSTIRRLPEADKMAMFTEEVKYSERKKGDFNDLFRARSVSPKVEGLRCCNPYKEFQPEVTKRQLKEVDLPFRRNVYNPITEGDSLNHKPVKTRVVHPEPSEEYLKLNNKKSVLPSAMVNAICASPRGRVHRESNKVLGEQHPEAISKQAKVQKRRYKEKNDAKGLIEYSYSPDFRDQGVSGKCTQVSFASLLVKPVAEEECN